MDSTTLRALTETWADLPLPGSGATLDRWRALAQVAAEDLVLAKLFESHMDALAILRELGRNDLRAPGQIWGVWCAEPPDRKVEARASGTTRSEDARIDGVKAWCSGAACVTHALVSCRDQAGESRLAAVAMAQPDVRITSEGWHAVGMAGTGSVDVVFESARASLVGPGGAYVHRPGFHHGAAGVAACWYGAAASIAADVQGVLRNRPEDPHALAHLGAIDVSLAQAASLLRAAAAAIDTDPHDPCAHAVQRARLAVEEAAQRVLQRAPRAVGAGPFAKNAHFARLMADLPVFIRQSHAERDQASHGAAVMARNAEDLWKL